MASVPRLHGRVPLTYLELHITGVQINLHSTGSLPDRVGPFARRWTTSNCCWPGAVSRPITTRRLGL